MKLTYWVADCETDSRAYSLRAKTKRECAEMRARQGAERFAEPRKIEVLYHGAFDLICLALGEGGIE